MEVPFKEKQENLLRFVTFSVTYFNDALCNEIKFLQPYAKGKDKETIKIYGALLKRANDYLKTISKKIGDEIGNYSEYCSVMDELCDEKIKQLRNAIKQLLDERCIQDSEFIARVECIRMLADSNVFCTKALIEKSSTLNKETKKLSPYILEDVKRIARNLMSWVCIYYKLPKDIDANTNNISEILDDVEQTFVGYKNFTEAFTTSYGVKDLYSKIK